jgi:hypothetical protein
VNGVGEPSCIVSTVANEDFSFGHASSLRIGTVGERPFRKAIGCLSVTDPPDHMERCAQGATEDATTREFSSPRRCQLGSAKERLRVRSHTRALRLEHSLR